MCKGGETLIPEAITEGQKEQGSFYSVLRNQSDDRQFIKILTEDSGRVFRNPVQQEIPSLYHVLSRVWGYQDVTSALPASWVKWEVSAPKSLGL